jgi:acetyl esterase/lipase
MAIDPVMRQILQAAPVPSITELGPLETRARIRESAASQPTRIDLPRIEDRTIDGGIPVRIYWPVTDTEGLPVVVFYHGGGFVICDLDTHDGMARAIAAKAETVVVSVDYRLAPENPYPAAVEDAFAALKWVAKNAGQLGADPARLAVAGDSAGGNLSAVVSQLARDAGGPEIKYQLLWYPATVLDASLPSMVEDNDPTASVMDIMTFLELYAGSQNSDDLPPTVAPGRAQNFTELPSAYIAVAGQDPLRDDGLRYAELLKGAGVPVHTHNAENLVHGYTLFASVVPAAAEAFDKALAALKAAL